MVRSEYNLGLLYRDGKGTPSDPAQAYLWIRKAAEDGDPDAEDYLGTILHEGLFGQKQDDGEARKWYLLAAQKNVLNSEATLAGFYFNGIGGNIDMAAGYAWGIQAAVGGYANACLYAARAFGSGEAGAPRDDVAAWVWTSLGVQWHPTSAIFARGLLAWQKELAGRMALVDLGRASRQAIAFLVLREQGGFSICPGAVSGELERSSLAKPEPYETNGSSIYLSVTIGNHGPYRFLLDTGSGYSMIDEKLGKQLGLNQIGVFPDSLDQPVLRRVVEADYSVAGNSVKEGAFQEIPLDDCSRNAGLEIDGILGYDFIQRIVLEVDYANHTIVLANPGDFHPSSTSTPLPISLEMGVPSVQAILQGRHGDPIPIWLVVDLGESGSIALRASNKMTVHIDLDGADTGDGEAFDRRYIVGDSGAVAAGEAAAEAISRA